MPFDNGIWIGKCYRTDYFTMKRYSSRRRRSSPLLVTPMMKNLLSLIAGIVLFAWFFFFFTKDSNGSKKKLVNLSKRLGGNKHRIAIIIPFVGNGPEVIPPYLEAFCVAAEGASSLVDFLLIHNGVLDGYHGDKCPNNVIFISLETMDNFSQKLVKVVDQIEDEETAIGSREKLARAVSKLIDSYPYILVEFKPALGHIFSEYIKGYSHWGYSDLDILFGDLPRWVTKDELNDYDIVTYSFGDQNRLYLRGQFTFHKNNEKINQLWRSCEYLSQMDQRLVEILTGRSKLRFESAEGCYSAAILKRSDIRVKYAVKAFTDVDEHDTSHSHGVYVSTGKQNSYTVLYKAGDTESDGQSLAKIADKWFEMKTDYNNPKKDLVAEVGKRERISLGKNTDAHCMFWAQSKYQSRLCIDNVDSTDTVFWIDGQLYKQKYEKMELPGNINTAPFFHFQEWKRFYRTTQLTGFHRTGPLKTFVLAKEGIVPLLPHEFQSTDSRLPSPLGFPVHRWNGVKNDDRRQLPGHNYCLRSGPRKVPKFPPAPECHFTTSWRDTKKVEILSGAPDWRQLDIQTEVTMVLTLQIQAEQAADLANLTGILNLLAMYLNRWQGQPSVLLIHVAGSTPEAIDRIRAKLGPGSDLSYYGLDTCLAAAIFSRDSATVSRKALLNMAIDAAPTRWVVSGWEIERGIAISQDAAFFAHRVSATHESTPGSIYIIPQFGIVNAESDFTISSLFKADKTGNVNEYLSKIEDESCEGGDDNGGDGSDIQADIFGDLYELWWQTTERFVSGTPYESNEKSIEEQALTLDNTQLALMSLLTEKRHYDLFVMDVSPIMLTDNMGPHNGILTSDLVRETEEFGGKLCYNGLRLAQLATYGYSINVLAGAFALSTPTTRSYASAGVPKKSSLGNSRCHGCFFFDEKHEAILEAISKDERARPAKAALLWESEKKSEPIRGHT